MNTEQAQYFVATVGQYELIEAVVQTLYPDCGILMYQMSEDCNVLKLKLIEADVIAPFFSRS